MSGARPVGQGAGTQRGPCEVYAMNLGVRTAWQPCCTRDLPRAQPGGLDRMRCLTWQMDAILRRAVVS
jgi:hypothetical protein